MRLYQGLSTPPVFWPLILSLRAQVHLMAGRPDTALELIDTALTVVPDRSMYGLDLMVIRGHASLMSTPANHQAAEEAFLSALRGAQEGGTRLTELHAATGLVELRRHQGLAPDHTDELRRHLRTVHPGIRRSTSGASQGVVGQPIVRRPRPSTISWSMRPRSPRDMKSLPSQR